MSVVGDSQDLKRDRDSVSSHRNPRYNATAISTWTKFVHGHWTLNELSPVYNQYSNFGFEN